MKKQLVSLFAMACMVFASSCSQEEIVSQSTGNEVAVTFTANLRNDVKSRAVGDDTDNVDQLVFAVYDKNGKELEQLRQTTDDAIKMTSDGDKKKATIKVVLVKGQTYSFAFWAQKKDHAAYSFNPETAKVEISYQNTNDKSADAFFASVTNYKVTGTFEKDVTLKRPFAQINFLTTAQDLKDAAKSEFIPTQSQIVVKNAATELNVLEGTVSGNTDVTFGLTNLVGHDLDDANADERAKIKSGDKYVGFTSSGTFPLVDTEVQAEPFIYLATAYFLPTVPTASTEIDASVLVKATGKDDYDLSVTKVKVQRNYRTNIYGNLLTSNGTFYVTVDPGFVDDYNYEEEDETTKVVGTIEEANTLFAKGETNVTITEAPSADAKVELPNSGASVTINFAFEEATDASTTITVGYKDNAAEKPDHVDINGNENVIASLIIDVPNSTATINVGEYTNVTATTKANTLYVPKGVKIGTLTLKKGNAEIYYGAVINLVKAEGYDDTITYLVDNGDGLKKAFDNGDIVKLLSDIEVDADNTITIAAGTSKTLELDGKILAGVSDQSSSNRVMIDVRGTLTVNNGTVTYTHEGEDMEWNAMVEPFYVGFNGTLNVNDVTIENMGGSAMAYCIDLVNATNTTLKIQNSTIKSTYIPVRVFNNGTGKNNVTIKDSTLDGKYSFWVHIFTTVDNKNKGIKDSTLDFDIYNNNTFKYSADAPTGIIYGFSSAYYYNEAGELVAIEIEDGRDLQSALDYATGDITISLLTDVTADVTVTQKENQKIIIQGNNKNYNGVITVDGKSKRYETAGLTIQNVNFTGDNLSADAYVNLGKSGDNNTRYTSNVTVKDCTFSTTATGDVVAVKSYTGGDHNLNIIGCTANTGMHSLAQLTNVEKGLKFEGCKVYSKNGVNLNSTPTFDMDDCTFDTKGYAIRVGVNGNVNTTMKTFNISNSTLKSACEEEDDAVIIFRGNAKYATLNLTNTTLTGTTEISGAENAIILINGVPTITVPENNTEDVVISAETVKVTVPLEAAVAGDKYEIEVKNESTETDKTTGETTVAFDLTMYKNGDKVSGNSTVYEVTKNIGTGLFISEVTHNGTALTKADTGTDQTYTYDSATGVLTIYTASFSPFAVTYADYKDYVRTKNFFYGGYISVSTGSDLLPIVAIMPEITNFCVFDGDTRITDAVTFRFSDVKKETISENSYKVSVNLAILDDKGNDLALKEGMPSTINGREYLHVYMNLIEVPAGYSIKEVKVGGDTALTKTESGNPATGEYWIGSDAKDLYFQSKTAGLIEVTLTK